MPQKLAGWRVQPPGSLPRAGGGGGGPPGRGGAARRAPATAAAEPPELPPGTWSIPQGFRVGKKAEFSVEEPIANSSMLVLPRRTASCAFRRRMAVASYGGR